VKVTLLGLEAHPKERPRSSGKVHYMSEGYRLWQAKFYTLWRSTVPMSPPFDERVSVWITWTTPTGLMRPDLDNAEAAVWDALVKVGILKDDKSKYVGGGVHRIEKGPIATTIGIFPYATAIAPWPEE
jgi:Holliday junction resolvase RusA-like endonuclease